MLPKYIEKFEFGIVNNDTFPSSINTQNPGSHWVCYYNDPKSEDIEFFDSFGLPPAKEILKFLKLSNKDISYNSSQIQDITSFYCGHYCIDYISNRLKGKSQYDTIHKFHFNPNQNDTMIRKYFSNK